MKNHPYISASLDEKTLTMIREWRPMHSNDESLAQWISKVLNCGIRRARGFVLAAK